MDWDLEWWNIYQIDETDPLELVLMRGTLAAMVLEALIPQGGNSTLCYMAKGAEKGRIQE